MFAPRYFGVRHFAPRHFAPGAVAAVQAGGGGSGAGRLAAQESYYSRDINRNTRAGMLGAFAWELPAEEAEKLEEIIQETPREAISAVAALAGADSAKTQAPPQKRRVAKETALKAAQILPKAENIDEIVRYIEFLWEIELWRRDEEDIAILLLSM